MKKQTFIFFISVLILFILSAYILISSTEKKEAVTSSEPVDSTTEEEMVVPNEIQNRDKYKIRVGLRFNNRGELIQFDSTYAKHYFTAKKNTKVMDSLIKKFNMFYNPLINQRLQQLFFEDSMLYYEFFHNDFFRHRYALNRTYMEDIMSELDSIKNNYYTNYLYLKK